MFNHLRQSSRPSVNDCHLDCRDVIWIQIFDVNAIIGDLAVQAQPPFFNQVLLQVKRSIDRGGGLWEGLYLFTFK